MAGGPVNITCSGACTANGCTIFIVGSSGSVTGKALSAIFHCYTVLVSCNIIRSGGIKAIVDRVDHIEIFDDCMG